MEADHAENAGYSFAAFVSIASASPLRAEAVDLELVLLADSTGSIGDDEIYFQRKGYADALAHSDVLDAIETGRHQRIAVTYVEWGDMTSQVTVVPWTVISSRADAEGFGLKLMDEPRLARGRNAIGSAIAYGAKEIDTNAFEGARKVIDFSADSANSWNGLPLAATRQMVLDKGITINGLAILCRTCSSGRPVSYDLEKAFEETIIGGDESFVVTAENPRSFSMAVRRKLILEIAGPAYAPGILAAPDDFMRRTYD
ncbi:MAG: DUF1194 domain-containing protein [Rhizobiales bacterium]|nr:DUF1194 domain-containing protein [Hyphomicrobiales bacterium]